MMHQVSKKLMVFALLGPAALLAAGGIVGKNYHESKTDQRSEPQYFHSSKEELSAKKTTALSDSIAADTVIPSIYSEDLRYGMDTTVLPCKDFYEYVNGSWRKEVKFPPSTPANRTFWNNFYDSPGRTYARLTEMMEEARKSYVTSSDPIVRLVGTFYQSCLVADSLEISLASMSTRKRKGAKPVKDSTREELCISRSRKYLGGAVGEMFAHNLEKSKSFDRMRHMLASIKAEVRTLIANHQLMSEADKQVAVNSLDKLYLRVGISDKATDYAGLELTPTDYFKNKETIANFNTVRSVNLIGSDMRELWKMSSFTANAFYSAAEHAIEVPPAMFIPPFFEPERDDALSYAASGVIIGHEIFHSLAAQLVTSENSEMLAQIDSFKALNSRLGTVDGWNTDGNRTYNEDIADLGGMKAAYGAWKKNSKDRKENTRIDGFTPDQRFFIAYGRLWRGKWNPAVAPNGDVHAAFFARINGIVKQMPEFAAAFGCKEGDKMVLQKSQLSKLW